MQEVKKDKKEKKVVKEEENDEEEEIQEENEAEFNAETLASLQAGVRKKQIHLK